MSGELSVEQVRGLLESVERTWAAWEATEQPQATELLVVSMTEEQYVAQRAFHIARTRLEQFAPDLAHTALSALARAEAAEAEVERLRAEKDKWFEKYLRLADLFDLPRLQGGVLSIAHDIDPTRPCGTLSTTVLRHEFRGRMREVELGWRDDPVEGLNSAAWRDRVIPAGDLLEALKVSTPRAALARPAAAEAGGGE